MPTISVPDYRGGSIINLVAEIEARLGGDPPSLGLAEHLSRLLPGTDGYVIVIFDGLGSAQTELPGAETFAGGEKPISMPRSLQPRR